VNHGSLFSGIGGFDLAAQWMGWENVFHCEFNPWCRRVLHHYWPNAKAYADIKETDFTGWRGAVDVLSGGFPCQPYSTAGKRRGNEDDRHLWPEMLRAIREIAPRWVVGENVRGLVSWSGGLVFDEVQSDLEAEGYEVLPFLLPACAVNAPHRRDRVWFIAHASGEGLPRREQHGAPEQGFQESQPHGPTAQLYPGVWSDWPTQSPVCGGDDGLPRQLDGATLSRWRNESIKAYGNAVVPQVPYMIFKAIVALQGGGQGNFS
jgi:DNA (cytosine-5)-methyltransferase 1